MWEVIRVGEPHDPAGGRFNTTPLSENGSQGRKNMRTVINGNGSRAGMRKIRDGKGYRRARGKGEG